MRKDDCRVPRIECRLVCASTQRAPQGDTFRPRSGRLKLAQHFSAG